MLGPPPFNEVLKERIVSIQPGKLFVKSSCEIKFSCFGKVYSMKSHVVLKRWNCEMLYYLSIL